MFDEFHMHLFPVRLTSRPDQNVTKLSDLHASGDSRAVVRLLQTGNRRQVGMQRIGRAWATQHQDESSGEKRKSSTRLHPLPYMASELLNKEGLT